jgi:hypothetical protein
MNVSKRFSDRARANLRRFQKVLESARARDVNESDTCVIISDFVISRETATSTAIADY